MQHITEKNERKARQHAIWLAISLHLVLAGFLYLQTSGTPHSGTANTDAATTLKAQPAAPKAKTVALP